MSILFLLAMRASSKASPSQVTALCLLHTYFFPGDDLEHKVFQNTFRVEHAHPCTSLAAPALPAQPGTGSCLGMRGVETHRLLPPSQGASLPPT